jgi:hypothetical protein
LLFTPLQRILWALLASQPGGRAKFYGCRHWRAAISPAATMTTFEEIDASLRAKGWYYDRGNELFMDGDRVLQWEDVLSLVPGTTVDEVVSYQDDKCGQGPQHVRI